MTTWISKTGIALTTFLALGACEGGQGPADLFSALQAPKVAEGAAVVALSQTKMANGAFTLVPPDGYCIDKGTLTQRFALMARCDALGVEGKSGGAAVGIITLSATPVGLQKTLPTAQETADAAKLARVDAVKSENNAVTFRAEGVPPNPEFGVTHWRGSAQIGTQVIGLALYGPEGGRITTTEGREVLNSLIRRTREASAS